MQHGVVNVVCFCAKCQVEFGQVDAQPMGPFFVKKAVDQGNQLEKMNLKIKKNQ